MGVCTTRTLYVQIKKMLLCLLFKKVIDKTQRRHILQVQSETGMSVRQILGELQLLDSQAIKPILTLGIQEVLLELFLLENGTFHFTDEDIGYDDTDINIAIHPITLKVSAQADEFRDFEKTVQSLDQTLNVTSTTAKQPDRSNPETALIQMAAAHTTVTQAIHQAPLASYEAMKIIQNYLQAGVLELVKDPQATPAIKTSTYLDPMFASYKRAVKKLIAADDILQKLEALLAFCKDFYDGILILTSKGPDIVFCKLITIDGERRIQQRSLNGQFGKIDADPVFQAVNRSGVGFFGKRFPSELICNVMDLSLVGECALIPIRNQADMSLFLYAYTANEFDGLSPHHYLELLSWMITPTAVHAPSTASQAVEGDTKMALTKLPPEATPTSTSRPSITRADAIVQKIKDLPPLPSLVSKALSMLGDPEVNLDEVEAVIGQDQALVAKLIKVSNSVLYGRVQKVNTLKQALARLGSNIVKSLILSSSTRSYFLKSRNGMGAWGQILWQHTVECGMAARRVAKALDEQNPEEAFIGGIIHDIGKLAILLVYPEKYKAIQKKVRADNQSDIQSELEVLGCSHEEIGYLLLDQWKMPESAKMCARFHHNIEDAGAYRKLASIIAYGNYFSHTHGAHPQTVYTANGTQITDPRTILKIPEDRLSKLEEGIVKDFASADLIG